MSKNFLELLDVNEVKALLESQISKLALEGYTTNLNKDIAKDTDPTADLEQIENNIATIAKVIDLYQAELDRLGTL